MVFGISKGWKKFIRIGITKNLDTLTAAKIRCTNFITFIYQSYYVFAIVVSLSLQREVRFSSALAPVLLFLVYWLNAKKLFLLSRWWLVLIPFIIHLYKQASFFSTFGYSHESFGQDKIVMLVALFVVFDMSERNSLLILAGIIYFFELTYPVYSCLLATGRLCSIDSLKIEHLMVTTGSFVVCALTIYSLSRQLFRSEKKTMLFLKRSLHKNKLLETANHELDQFLYSVSHDIRSPLASIKGLLLLKDADRDNGAEYVNFIAFEVQRLEQFVFRVESHFQATRAHLVVTEIDFRNLVAHYRTIYPDIEVGFHISESSPFYTDAKCIQILFDCLMSNVCAFRDLTKSRNYVVIQVQTINQICIISFKDNGIGIRSDQLHKIYDMFYRGDSASKGSGLGLYIVKSLLKRLHGSIEVSSSIGVGSEFTIRIPNSRPLTNNRHLISVKHSQAQRGRPIAPFE